MSFARAVSFIILFGASGIVAKSAEPYSGGSCDSIVVAVQTAAGGTTISGSSGAFSVAFGNLDGFGIGTGSAGLSIVTTSSGATYSTPVTLKVTYANCSGGLAFTIKIYQDSTASAASKSAARGGSSKLSVAALPTSSATALTISTPTNNGNGTITLTYYAAVFISNANGASSVSGSLAPRFIFLFVAQ